ncbi:MotA/TolQ/ExbB proton channel family protein, partial [candidate division KSB1 bacterium]|nr:MotA/TolQ/ExbB proton channel family protein [candidate division KSB1 bacterium]
RQSMSLFDIIVKGRIMMIPIILCSFIAVIIFVERYLALRKIRINSRKFVLQVKNLIMHNRLDEAILLCKNTPGPIAGITKAALLKRNRPRDEIKDAIESAGQAEIYHLERYMGILATIAAIAPMFGFLGTVTGMIRAFMQLQERGGNVDAGVLAGGIWEALLTTAAGLIVGIPALIGYNWIQAKVEHHVFEMQESSNEMLDLLLESEAGHEVQHNA